MSAFKQQVLKENDVRMVVGENGHATLCAKGLGDNLLALFDRFFQGIAETDLRNFLIQILREARDKKDTEQVVNVFVMAFHTRWCRGGKGAKDCFYKCLKILFEEFPSAVVKVLPLVPQFGYWKDLILLVEEVKTSPALGVDYSLLLEAVWTCFGSQLMEDYHLLERHKATGQKGRPALSFAGKWAPREGNHFDKQLNAVSCISKVMFDNNDDGVKCRVRPRSDFEDDVIIGDDGEEITIALPPQKMDGKPRRVKYRHVISSLTAALDVPEVKMAGGRYGDINISAVPSKCMTKFVKAFANEELKKALTASEESTGNRFPENGDRVLCREHLIDSVMSGKGVQGSQNYPHEYVEKVTQAGGRCNMSTTTKLTINAQWKSMRESIETMVAQRAAVRGDDMDTPISANSSPLAPKFTLGNVVPLSDVSGSMSGTPMMVSIALGILCSELTNEAFRDLVLTFTSNAEWSNLGDCADFTSKVETLHRAPWGGSTNFYAAMRRVADVVRKSKLTQADIPNLLVISDMQFNSARGYEGKAWSTVYENIKGMFHDLGMKVHGESLQPPTIIFWNVRGSVGYPAAADDEGVVLVSGYSPSLMKFILSGELEEEVVEEEIMSDGEVKVSKERVKMTPADMLKKVLYDEGLNPVREALQTLSPCDLKVSSGDLLTGVVHEDKPKVAGQRRGGRGRR